MEKITIIGIVSGLLLAATCVYGFVESCQEKYNYNFFTKGTFAAMTSAVVSGLIGIYFRQTAVNHDNGHTTGLVLLSIAGMIVVSMVYRNFQQTNFWYGLFGSIMQVAVLGAAGVAVIVLVVSYAGIKLIGQSVLSGITAERDDDLDDWATSEDNPASAYYKEDNFSYGYHS